MPFDKVIEFSTTIKDTYKMLRDFTRGIYKIRPTNTILVLLISVIYVVLPIDLIPDLIPIIGIVDDAVVLGIAYRFIKNDVTRYRIWKMQNNHQGQFT